MRLGSLSALASIKNSGVLPNAFIDLSIKSTAVALELSQAFSKPSGRLTKKDPAALSPIVIGFGSIFSFFIFSM